MSWKVVGLLGATAVVATGLSVSKPAMSSDHRDGPALTATGADPAADINDVYTWMDGNNFVLAMTVFPFADATAKFSDVTQYVFHLTSGAAYGAATASTNVICTFDAAQKVSCWVGTDDYVNGDASVQAGITSASGKTKVFAGRRGDPFFFNLQGFNDTVAAVEAKAAANQLGTPNGAGCYPIGADNVAAVVGLLKEETSSANPAKTQADDFKTAQALALVVSIDKSLVTKGGPIVSVWGSTNK